MAAAGLPGLGTFEHVAREWHARMAPSWSTGHAVKVLALMVNDLFPYIGARPLAELSAPELLTHARRVEARGAVETAYRALKAAGAVFRFGVQRGYCESDPTRDLKGAIMLPVAQHRAAVTDPAKLGELLRASDAYQVTPVVRAALALAPMVFLRPGELRHAEWAEFDLDGTTWTIPAARTKGGLKAKKNGPPHIVPLAPQAVAILRDLRPLTGKGRYVFPSPLTPGRPLSDNGVLSALRRMGFGKDEMTGHGFRATARTITTERLGIAPELIKVQLAHAVGDAMRCDAMRCAGPGLQPNELHGAAARHDGEVGRLPRPSTARRPGDCTAWQAGMTPAGARRMPPDATPCGTENHTFV